MTFKLQHILPGDPPDAFPATHTALRQPNGLLAVGGDLSTERLISAYSRGIFPWFSEGEPILWWTPDPRTVFRPGEVHVSKKLQRLLKRGEFAVTLDGAFADVMLHCAQPRRRDSGTWLLPNMRAAYQALHEKGFAHSVEVWQHGQLVGGLYGIALGRAFFGESMFSRRSDMSKVALVMLSRQLKEWGFLLFDGQVGSAHLYRMGAVDIPRAEFEKLLCRAVPTVPRPARWENTPLLPAPAEHLPAFLQN